MNRGNIGRDWLMWVNRGSGELIQERTTDASVDLAETRLIRIYSIHFASLYAYSSASRSSAPSTVHPVRAFSSPSVLSIIIKARRLGNTASAVGRTSLSASLGSYTVLILFGLPPASALKRPPDSLIVVMRPLCHFDGPRENVRHPEGNRRSKMQI